MCHEYLQAIFELPGRQLSKYLIRSIFNSVWQILRKQSYFLVINFRFNFVFGEIARDLNALFYLVHDCHSKGGEFRPRAEAGLERVFTVSCMQTCIYFDSFNMKRGFGVIIVKMTLYSVLL